MARYGIKDNQVRAFNKMIRISTQKLNLVCAMVRGLPVGRAIDVLKFSKKRVAGEVLKTLMSAIANAEHNKNLAVDTLFVKEIWCGKALTMKRIMPGPRGSARPILKPFSNLTIVLESGVAPKKETAKKKETKKEAK
ncbi:MAG: 50S ribosomal protein L22 [Alphaproteobacteria bacterium]|jgi:large subunit ribosomal protein L22|nr:50S ribosomal protein L22 [Alphaproteobacteria bacterium]MBQ6027772.1 50S ribosomal protein L22 [Alphaproteobacteria bacterium]